jgi:hypothetical protein
MRLLAFAASLRRDSWNKKLLQCGVALAQAQQAFTPKGGLKDPQLSERLSKMVMAYLEMGRKLSAGRSDGATGR